MEQELVKSLFLRFIRNGCDDTETSIVIFLLQTTSAQKLYGELMDQVEMLGAIDPVNIPSEEIEKKFDQLENLISRHVIEISASGLNRGMYL